VSDLERDRDAYRARLVGAGLGAHADALLALARPAVRLVPDPDAAVVERGSRLGGTPDLDPGTPWPERDGRPLAFVAQVDLATVAPHDVDGVLPRDGLLSFFYDVVDLPWGFDPADRGGSVVLHTPASATTQPRPAPEALRDADAVFGEVALDARAELSAPPYDVVDTDDLGLTADEQEALADLEADDLEQTTHRLLGHPVPIQGDMRLECQLVAHGLYCGDASGYDDPRAETLAAGAEGWRLLLQVDSEEAIDMMWGDSGRLYFWIPQDGLAAHDWSTHWLVLQCY
jgi:uncharacterized protein YwqG